MHCVNPHLSSRLDAEKAWMAGGGGAEQGGDEDGAAAAAEPEQVQFHPGLVTSRLASLSSSVDIN